MGITRIAVAALLLFSLGVARAQDVDAARMLGTWTVEDHNPSRVNDPIVISAAEISWVVAEDKRKCTAGYHIVSRIVGPNYPGGLIKDDDAGVVYTTLQLELDQQDCEANIASFAISFASGETDFGHFAAFNAKRQAQGWGAIRRLPSKKSLPPAEVTRRSDL